MTAPLLGPILSFRGGDGNLWRVSAIVAVAGKGRPPKLNWGARKNLGSGSSAAPATLIHAFPAPDNVTAQVFRFDMEVPQTEAQQQIYYKLDAGSAQSFVVPPIGQAPRMAYASCNGFSDPKVMKKIDDNNYLWKDVAKKHAREPFNMLLMGGDQIYSDSMWTLVPELRAWSELNWKERKKARFAPMRAAVDAFFFNTYVNRWAQPEVAAMFASIPTSMMWDDHDIFDGWGSYPDDQRRSEVYQGIFEIARVYFRVFQLGAAADETRAGTIPGQKQFSFGHRVADVAVLALDLRSERTEGQVMTDESWNAVERWMDGVVAGCTHLFLLSSIPVVHPDFGLVERLLGALPGQQELEDDLKDHWRSLPHRKERLRLIHRLFNFSAANKCRVTILSGDVHVGALGMLQSDRMDAPINARVINQLTSSGIVHPAPPGMVLYFLESVADKVERIDRGITAEMVEFPATSYRFIGARNWLSLEADPERTIWANWFVEAVDEPYTKAIHAVEAAPVAVRS